MIRRKRTSIVLPVLALLAISGAAAGMDEEFYVNTYRRLGRTTGLGQRAAAMGHTGAGIADGASSISINPAGLGAFVGYSVEGGVGVNWLDDGLDDVTETTVRIGGALSLESWKPGTGCNQSIGGQFYDQRFSGAAENMKFNQTGFTLGYGAHVMPDLVAGVSAALFDGDFKATGASVPFKRSFTGGEFKVGAIYRVSDQMTVGGVGGFSTGSYNEKGDYAAGNSSGDLTRWNAQVGVGYQICDATLLAGDVWYDHLKTDVSNLLHEKNRSWGVSAGIEQQVLPDTMVLRGGMYYDRTSYSSHGQVGMFTSGNSFGKGRVGFTAGAAIKLFSFDIGYTLDVDTKGDVKNLVDISAEW